MKNITTKNFMTANDVALYLDVSTAKAYQIIRALNKELSEKGYLTLVGKVSRAYFEEKIYGETSGRAS